MRKLIIDETPINPKYYETMSELLDALIEQRKREAIDYEKYLAEIVALTKRAKKPAAAARYPAGDPLKAVATTGVIDDAALSLKIKAKMVLDDYVKARTIDVTTDGSTVTVSGTVRSVDEHILRPTVLDSWRRSRSHRPGRAALRA